MRVPTPLFIAVLLLGVALLVLAAPAPVGGQEPMPPGRPVRVEYRLPVPGAPILDPFRPPANPYGPGNRGLELAADPGTTVLAAAAGTVSFAGAVASSRYVTVVHADRLRTTYGPLATVVVGAGESVAAGEPVGTAGGAVLWTARAGDAYLDPAVLLAASGAPHVHLVPTRAGPGGRGGGDGEAPVPADAARWALDPGTG